MQLVVLFKQSGRIDQVCRLYRIKDVRDRYRGFQQFRRIRRDLELGFGAALYHDRGHAAHAIQTRSDLVRCHLPELGLGNFVRCQAVTHNRKRSDCQSMALDLRSGGKLGRNLGKRRVNQLERLEHVHLPVEEEIDLCRAPAGNGANGLQSLHTMNCLLHRARHRHHHLVNRHDSVVNGDDDARKIRRQKHSNRNRESLVRSNDCDHNDHKDDGCGVMHEPPARPGAAASFAVPGIRSLSHGDQSLSLAVPASPLAGVGFSTFTLVLSGNPYAPWVTTCSPGLSPETICACSGVWIPTFTSRASATPSELITMTCAESPFTLTSDTAGTTNASCTVSAVIEMRAVVPGRSCCFSFFAAIHTSTVVLPGSSAGLTKVTVAGTASSPGMSMVALSPLRRICASASGI